VRWASVWAPALLLLALLLRAGYVGAEQPGFYFEDSLDFDRAARSLLENGRFDDRYARFPLFPIFLAGSYGLLGDGLLPFRMVQAALGTGICFVIYRIGTRLFGSRAGLFALAAAAVYPLHVVLAGIEYPILLGTGLVWCAFLFAVAARGDRSRRMVFLAGAGGSAGLAALCFEGGWVAAVFLLLWTLTGWRQRRTGLTGAALSAGVFLIVVAPWFAVMVRRGDYRPVVFRAGVHLPTAPGLEPPVGTGSGKNLLFAKLRGMASRPGWTVGYVTREFFHFWSPYPDRLNSADEAFRRRLNERDPRMRVENPLVGGPARLLYAVGFSALLLAAGAGSLAALHRVRGSGFLAAWPVVLGLAYAPFFTQMRYRIPADPSFLLLGAFAADLAVRGTLGAGLLGSLRAVWQWWKRVALKIAVVQTFLILLLLFAAVLGPIAVLMRLFRKDPMRAPTDPGSFWAIRERTREKMEDCLRQF
jgi:4-amino-4-deoxy-L-arabinose transferase-like glycosyltransferase